MLLQEIPPAKNLGSNRQIYERLKQALELGLRRQVFLAVCDDLRLSYRLATGLARDLGTPDTPEPTFSYPRLVSLELMDSRNRQYTTKETNLIGQIEQWLGDNPPPKRVGSPCFQVLGVEGLTRQSTGAQWSFLSELREIETSLREWDYSLLLWLPRPWCNSIARNAPEFWRSRTGVFEFEGEPTPTKKTGRRGDGETGRRGDGETGRRGDSENSPGPLVPQSPSPPLPPSPLRRLVENSLGQLSGGEVQELVLAILSRIEVLEAQSQPQVEELGNAYLSLGNLYRDAIASGASSGECLEVAIAAYERVLPLLDSTTPLWADLGNDVGNFYWMLSRFRSSNNEKISCLELSANAYQKALEKVKLNQRISAQGTIENNLGTVLGELARYREPVANLERSIAAYKEALLIRQAELETAILSPAATQEMHHSAAKAYAATQNNLGTAYWNLAQHGEPVAHLQAAIAAYKEALAFYNPQEQPLDYGMIHNNLGTAYWNLSQHENPKENLLLAIGAYQVALMYRTAQVAPAQSASTHNNLGTAYSHLAKISQDEPSFRLQFFSEAIAAYTTAIDIASHILQSATNGKTPPPLAFDIFAAHNNLGLAHYHLATETPEDSLDQPSRQRYLETALSHHVQAYTGWSDQKSELAKTAFSHLLQTIRGFYHQLGIMGQSRALSIVPGNLLPEIMRRL